VSARLRAVEPREARHWRIAALQGGTQVEVV
jgi:hypothetical protein